MIWSFLLNIIPDLAASAAAIYVARSVVPIFTAKLAVKTTTEIVKSKIENKTNMPKLTNNLEKVENAGKDNIRKVVETKKEIYKNVSPANMTDPNAFAKYCLMLSYAYGKYGDDELLRILKDRGCITDEDIQELKELEKQYEQK